MDVWEKHPTIYHYTTAAGLTGILTSRTLHSTHYKFLNDLAETTLLHKRMEDYLVPYFKKAIEEFCRFNPKASEAVKKMGGITEASKYESRTLCGSFHGAMYHAGTAPSMFEPFIISFCGHSEPYEQSHGLLSQWRAYANGGYAIAFDTEKLWRIMQAEYNRHAHFICSLGNVVYDGDDESFKSEFNELIETIPKIVTKNFFSELKSKTVPVDDMFRPFAASSVRFKHRGFKEEQEVRAVLSPISNYWLDAYRRDTECDHSELLKKAQKAVLIKPTLAPYIELGGDTPLPIQYIIVGPDRSKLERTEKLKKLLEILELNIEIKVSDTPLV